MSKEGTALAMQPTPYRLIVLGGGSAGWMAAAGLRKLLGEDYEITLIESDEIGIVGVGEATLPHIKLFNDMLGLDEAEFMRETGGTFKLGIEFRGWFRPGESYIHPFGAFGEPWRGVDFQHYWLRAKQAGEEVLPLQRYSYSVQLARRDGFHFPDEDPQSVGSTFSYAYHFDAGRYADFLRRWSMQRGVHRIEGQVCEVLRDQDNGDVRGLKLKSGEEVAGDFFVDCSGFRSLLVGDTLQTPWQDWTHWLPCDRALAVPCERAGELTPYTRSTAQQGGWIWRIPLQHRTGNGYVFSSRFIDADDAATVLVAQLDGAAQAEPRLLRFAPGRREQAWRNNCVAVGLSSGFLEPLESTSIYLIQAAVIDLARLMPGPGSARSDPRLAAEFNRLFEMHYERIRDFLVLHYAANDRVGEPLWDYVRAMPLPDTLAHKIELFRARGTAPNYQFGLFSRDSWLAVFEGQGIHPLSHDPLAEAIDLEQTADRLEELSARIEGRLEGVASQADFLTDYCGPGHAREAAA